MKTVLTPSINKTLFSTHACSISPKTPALNAAGFSHNTCYVQIKYYDYSIVLDWHNTMLPFFS